LTALRGFIDYARSTGSDLFAGVEWFRAWGDFLGQAVPLLDAFERLGIASFGTVLPLADSLSGNPAPRREKGTRVAARTANGVGTCGADDNQGQAGHLIPSTGDVSHFLNAGGMGRQDYETETLIAHALRAEGFDASEDGTGRGTPLVPVVWDDRNQATSLDVYHTLRADQNRLSDGVCCFTAKDHGADASDISPTMRCGGKDGGPVMPAVAFMENQQAQIWEADTVQALNKGGGKPGQGYPAIRQASAVRRLTPEECEKLQGFPPGYTAVPYRNKPAADGPRYKALGNSMAVPVMAWIGERIAKVEAMTAAQAEAA
jgi:DNA (cytosine-5)-methyltransferase 1